MYTEDQDNYSLEERFLRRKVEALEAQNASLSLAMENMEFSLQTLREERKGILEMAVSNFHREMIESAANQIVDEVILRLDARNITDSPKGRKGLKLFTWIRSLFWRCLQSKE